MEQQVEQLRPQLSPLGAQELSNGIQDPMQFVKQLQDKKGQEQLKMKDILAKEMIGNLSASDRQMLMNRDTFKMPMALKRDMTVIITEILPVIIVSDSNHFMEAIFTKEAINEFRRNWSHLKFS